MERIIAAAYLVKPEFIKEGSIYKTGSKNIDDIYRCRIGRHHAEILHIFRNQVEQFTDGFYTSYGRYVDRKEAAQIALACGQVKKLHYWGDKLDSSDLWDFDENDNFISNYGNIKFSEGDPHTNDIFTTIEPEKMMNDFCKSKLKLYGISPSEIEIAGYVKGIKDTIEKLKTLGYINES